jgi:hypothetical protein
VPKNPFDPDFAEDARCFLTVKRGRLHVKGIFNCTIGGVEASLAAATLLLECRT